MKRSVISKMIFSESNNVCWIDRICFDYDNCRVEIEKNLKDNRWYITIDEINDLFDEHIFPSLDMAIQKAITEINFFNELNEEE